MEMKNKLNQSFVDNNFLFDTKIARAQLDHKGNISSNVNGTKNHKTTVGPGALSGHEPENFKVLKRSPDTKSQDFLNIRFI